jgi:hypothetical protein
MMRTLWLMAVAVAGLSACKVVPIAETFSGSVALVRDSAEVLEDGRMLIYYVSAVNGRTVEVNSLDRTRKATADAEDENKPDLMEHRVAPAIVTVDLEGRSFYRRPVDELKNALTMFRTRQTIAFDAKPDTTYVVKGVLKSSGSQVWLENANTGERVGAPVAPSK